jgi:4-carboxymuconolactone decarboxylase
MNMRPATPRSPRVQPLQPAEWGEFLRRRFETGQVLLSRSPNIHATLSRTGTVYERWSSLAQAIYSSSLPSRDRELAVLRTAYRSASDYEWGQHVLVAQECGFSLEEINRVREGSAGIGWSARDRIVLQAVDELQDDLLISDETWESLLNHFALDEAMAFVFLVGFYTLTAMALRTFGVQREEGIVGIWDE